MSTGAHSSTSTVEHSGLVKIPVFFYSVDVPDQALGAIVADANAMGLPSAADRAGSGKPGAQTHHWSEHFHAPEDDTMHPERRSGESHTTPKPFGRSRQACHG